MSKKSCMNCLFCEKFIQSTSQCQSVYICCGEPWTLNDDGSQDLMEVSEFDAAHCLLFESKK